MGIRGRTCVSFVLGLTIVTTLLAAPPARAAAPSVQLVGTYAHVTAKRFSKLEPAFVNLGAWIESVGGAFELQAKKDPSDYSLPITVQQVDGVDHSTPQRDAFPPGSAEPNWFGLSNFFQLDVEKAITHKPISSEMRNWCPSDGERQRTTDDGPTRSAYLQYCSGGTFTRGMVWGIDQGWAVDALGYQGAMIFGHDGDYNMTLSIAEPYKTLLGPTAADTVTVLVHVVTDKNACCGPKQRPDRSVTSHGKTSTPPTCTPPTCTPDADTVPDLVALPAWSITTFKENGHNFISFAATEWNGGPAPLIVEGFRRSGEATMDAYEYFYRNGQPVARTPAGTLMYHRGGGHNHWHFHQFAEYSLMPMVGTSPIATSGKESWCLAPTDAVDLTVPGASWNPGDGNLFTACGQRSSLWVRETMDVGWGDTYYQSVSGQAIDITTVPDGDYRMRVEVNPETSPGVRPLVEASTSNNVEDRVIHLGTVVGTNRRTVTADPWHGITE